MIWGVRDELRGIICSGRNNFAAHLSRVNSIIQWDSEKLELDTAEATECLTTESTAELYMRNSGIHRTLFGREDAIP